MERKLFIRMMRGNKGFYYDRVDNLYASNRGKNGIFLVADTVNAWRTKRGVVQPWQDGSTLLLAPSEYIASLEAVERQIRSLRETRQNLVEEAARRGRPAKLSDLEE